MARVLLVQTIPLSDIPSGGAQTAGFGGRNMGGMGGRAGMPGSGGMPGGRIGGGQGKGGGVNSSGGAD